MTNQDRQEVDITVLVTCYNEAEFIADTLNNVVAALQEVGCIYEVLVIDDMSKDNSVSVIQEYIRSNPDARVMLHANPKNRGLANNYVEGAFLGQGKYYRLCCGDNCEAKEVLVNVFRHLGKADMVIPYQLQHEVVGKSPMRRSLSRMFTSLVNLVSGYRIKYYNGMAIHLRWNVLRWHPSSYGFGFQADIITRLLDEGMSYLQVPSSSVDRKGKKSTALTMRNFLSVCHTFLEITIRRIRKCLYGKNLPKPVEIQLKDYDIPSISQIRPSSAGKSGGQDKASSARLASPSADSP
jgi:glycosyltransferase involved in cell wall biosynthesis